MRPDEISRYAGQMIACSPRGTQMDRELLALIEEIGVGSVILFKRSCGDSDALRQFVAAMQRRARLPLLVMIDQEGGRVMRIQESMFKLPPARELAALDAEEITRRTELLGKRLVELGINCNLAPVLDIDSNPANPVIGDRAFGRTPEAVWPAAEAYWKGLKKAGVIACGKHFPGHGDTDTDSHLELPLVNHPLERLEEVELQPFISAINAGIETLMVAHVVYPALDPDEPASLSPVISNELLRGKLGYQGVAIADDMEMKAISDRYPVRELARKLVTAGMDILLVCHTYELAFNVHRALVRLVTDGEIPAERLKQSYDRITALKIRTGLMDPEDAVS